MKFVEQSITFGSVSQRKITPRLINEYVKYVRATHLALLLARENYYNAKLGFFGENVLLRCEGTFPHPKWFFAHIDHSAFKLCYGDRGLHIKTRMASELILYTSYVASDTGCNCYRIYNLLERQ